MTTNACNIINKSILQANFREFEHSFYNNGNFHVLLS